MAIVEVTVVPLGTAEPGLSKYVAGCQEILEQEEKIEYQLTPMGTIIEGDLELIFALIKKMHHHPFEQGALRVTTSIKIDERRDKKASMKQKLGSVHDKLES
ncbi:MTH1187 family thiamine-binding protein [Natroniella acetigena]|uniref:MTH1187 family thiamine-binding protein n=1 Tax=Natroniella acetigena TaxID=52004 RepID=UPI002009E9BF|nr:MTH1187 family thiamine-binding protein [Natroniella acetigena]MCK8827208.1 MTH1187 family thiamine-binding protein [Natroniella acetigena]